jgi:hypothetical protein
LIATPNGYQIPVTSSGSRNNKWLIKYKMLNEVVVGFNVRGAQSIVEN